MSSTIALVSFDSLGDSLIYLLIAENLRLNGYDITLFSNVAHSLRKWIPDLKILPTPKLADADEVLKGFTLTIVSPPSFWRNTLTQEALQAIREKYVLVCQNPSNEWYFDHTTRLSRVIPPEQLTALRGLPSCGGAMRFKNFGKESIVDIALSYMRERMHLERVERSVKLQPPLGLTYKKNPKRIIVSPDSAGPKKKEWGRQQFLKLCKSLKKRGYQPVIVVAPKNHAYWSAMANNQFSTPLFENLGDLAAYIYESGAVIANDSGNGHLASFLGIPTLTIYRKRNPHFNWRPSWTRGIVVCPAIRLPRPGRDPLWQPFISVRRVCQSLDRLLNHKEEPKI